MPPGHTKEGQALWGGFLQKVACELNGVPRELFLSRCEAAKGNAVTSDFHICFLWLTLNALIWWLNAKFILLQKVHCI